ncbi:unnamed protein product, partial [marine sediment metagenome]
MVHPSRSRICMLKKAQDQQLQLEAMRSELHQ